MTNRYCVAIVSFIRAADVFNKLLTMWMWRKVELFILSRFYLFGFVILDRRPCWRAKATTTTRSTANIIMPPMDSVITCNELYGLYRYWICIIHINSSSISPHNWIPIRMGEKHTQCGRQVCQFLARATAVNFITWEVQSLICHRRYCISVNISPA